MNIIFDFDGTLFDTRTVDITAFNRALHHMGRKELSADVILASIGKPIGLIAKDYLGTDDDDLIKRFVTLALEFELEEIKTSAKMFPHAIELLQSLKATGHNLAICSNGTKDYVISILKKFGILSMFDIVWHKHDRICNKSALSIVIDRMPNEKSIFIGDRKEDWQAAKANGITFIGAGYGFGGDELAGVRYIASELPQIFGLVAQIHNQ